MFATRTTILSCGWTSPDTQRISPNISKYLFLIYAERSLERDACFVEDELGPYPSTWLQITPPTSVLRASSDNLHSTMSDLTAPPILAKSPRRPKQAHHAHRQLRCRAFKHRPGAGAARGYRHAQQNLFRFARQA